MPGEAARGRENAAALLKSRAFWPPSFPKPSITGKTLPFCDLGLLLHQTGRDAEQEESLRQSIRFANDIIAAEPTLIYRRVIIAKALMALANLEAAKGISAPQKSCFWMRNHMSKPV